MGPDSKWKVGGHAGCWGQGHLQRGCLRHRSCGRSRLPCVAPHPTFPPLLGPLLLSLSPGACRLLPCTPGRGGWPLALAPLPVSSLGPLSSQRGPQNGPLPRSRAKGPQGAGRGGLGWGCQDQGWMQVRWARHPRLPQNTHTHTHEYTVHVPGGCESYQEKNNGQADQSLGSSASMPAPHPLPPPPMFTFMASEGITRRDSARLCHLLPDVGKCPHLRPTHRGCDRPEREEEGSPQWVGPLCRHPIQPLPSAHS